MIGSDVTGADMCSKVQKGSITRGYLQLGTNMITDVQLYSTYQKFLKDPANANNPPWLFQSKTQCSETMLAKPSYSNADAWDCLAKATEVEEISKVL